MSLDSWSSSSYLLSARIRGWYRAWISAPPPAFWVPGLEAGVTTAFSTFVFLLIFLVFYLFTCTSHTWYTSVSCYTLDFQYLCNGDIRVTVFMFLNMLVFFMLGTIDTSLLNSWSISKGQGSNPWLIHDPLGVKWPFCRGQRSDTLSIGYLHYDS